MLRKPAKAIFFKCVWGFKLIFSFWQWFWMKMHGQTHAELWTYLLGYNKEELEAIIFKIKCMAYTMKTITDTGYLWF